MSGRVHDRSHFFKYSSIETAARVIESKSFRWSSPIKFNDPFDHQAGFVLDINPDEFAHLLTASIERLIFSDRAITRTTRLSEMILRLRSFRDRISRDDILEGLHESSREVASNIQNGIGQLNVEIQEHLCHARIFCVSEKHDNVVMWSHYADEHRGVVFRLRCIDEIDNTLLAARKVTYSDSFLAFPSADRYAMHLTGEEPLDMVSLCGNIAYTKHIDWSYEKEWRVHMALLGEPPGDGYNIYRENPKIFEAVYLGCRMDDKDSALIARLVRQHLPETKIYRGEKSRTAFALTFTELNVI